MSESNVVLPSKPRIVSEKEHSGVFEIDGLYPGYGHTIGNSLRRIILSSLPGAAIVSVKIDGVDHEFSTMEGVREDVIALLLNLRRVRFVMHTDEPQTVTLEKKGDGVVTAADIQTQGQIDVLNPEQHIGTVTNKNTTLSIEMHVEQGLGYVSKDVLQSEKVDIGTIALDAVFTPIRRVNYEVENMRVGERTDFNRLRFFIETDGTLTAREALERSIDIMINQLRSIVGFKEEEPLTTETAATATSEATDDTSGNDDTEVLKTRVETLDLSTRTTNALEGANIRTIGGLVRKHESDILELDGIGDKGLTEIKEALKTYNVSLKEG